MLLWPAAGRAAPEATRPEPPPAVHVVVKGDTLVGIADRLLVRRHDWRSIARANRIAAPRRLPVGTRLTIPAALLRSAPATADVAAFSGAVAIAPGGAARLGMTIGEGAILTTGANSFVTLTLADGSRVTLPSQSRVRIEALRTLAPDGRLERRFVVESGRGEFEVTPRTRQEDRFLVKTPVAVAAVRGTEFLVAHEGGRSVVSVIVGEVAGRPQGLADEVGVAAGQAALLAPHSIQTRPLLPPPVLLRPGRLYDDPELVFELVDAAGARRRVQLARDAGFVDRFAEIETSGNAARFTGVGNGTFYVRVTAIDADGIEGVPSSYAIERFLNSVSAEAGEMPGHPRRTLFRWVAQGAGTRTYDFVLARDEGLTQRIVDVPGLAATDIAVTGLAPGTWFWRVTVTARDGTRRYEKALPVRTLTIARPER